MNHFLPRQFSLSLILLALLSCSSLLHASHFMGGDITYKHIGGEDYEVTLILYRDCGGVSMSSQENISINGNSFTLPRVQINEITPLCPGASSNCSSGSVSGVEEHIYRDSITIAGIVPGQDVVISWSSCCRNSVITNLTNGGSADMYLESSFDPLALPRNNSPQFLAPPITNFCVGQLVEFPAGAFDADGDSLVYSLAPCKEDQSSNVTYAPGFSGTNPLTTASGFSIDQATGVVSFTPTQAEVGIFCILIEEYRDGVKIGEISRDVQVQVGMCADNAPVIGAVSPQTAQVGTPLCINISVTDADLGDSLSLAAISSLPGATFVQGSSLSPATGTFCWTPTPFDQGQTYTVAIFAKDNACPINRVAYRIFTITVPAIAACSTSTLSLSSVVTDGNCVRDTTNAINLTPSGGNPPYSYRWTGPGGFQSTQQDINNIAPGEYTVQVIDTSNCLATKTDTVSLETIPPVLSCPPSSVVQTDSGSCTASVNYAAITATDNCGLVQSPGSYVYSAIPFLPVSDPIIPWNNVSLSDDQVSSALPVGFTFDFYENSYSDFYISSNGFVTFSGGLSNGCCSGQNIPNTNNPNNLIALCWEDYNPGAGGTIRYRTIGSTPNRILLVEFVGVPPFGSGPSLTSQLSLYEGTNLIEIHTTSTSNSGNTTQGIENIDGTVATAVPGRNAQSWSATNDGVRFTYIPGGGIIDQTAGLMSGEIFPVGTTTNTFVAYDINGNIDSCSFDITVQNNSSPVISFCPGNITSCEGDTVVYPGPFFDDNCVGTNLSGTLISGQASGTVFPLGNTTVTYQYPDSSSSTTLVCSFNVSVSLKSNIQMLPIHTCPGDLVNVAQAVRDYSFRAVRVNFYDADPNGPGANQIGAARMFRGTVRSTDRVFVSPLVTTTYWLTGFAANGCEQTLAFTVTVSSSCNALIAPVAMLEGAFNPATGLQRSQLQQSALIPAVEPYSGLGYTFVGGGGETMSLSPNMTANIVDWVVIELRDPTDPSHITFSRAALLLDNGQVVDTDGISQLSVTALPAGSYYVAIIHRNHLGVMTAQPVSMGTAIDFTDTNLTIYGSTNTRVVKNGKALLYAGDADGNGQVQNTDDVMEWAPAAGTGGYKQADYNLDGQVQNTDRIFIWTRNVGRGSAVPR